MLIDAKPEKLLPEWLRFLKGVIDSEDLPLNISRESMQDSALIQKLNTLITKRYLKFLEKEVKNDPEKYEEFYQRFSRFLKEGVATSYEHQEQIAGLLRFESSMTEAGKLTNFAQYIDRAKDEQEEVYYLVGMSREAIESGPYLEAFKARGLEVLFLYRTSRSIRHGGTAAIQGQETCLSRSCGNRSGRRRCRGRRTGQKGNQKTYQIPRERTQGAR